MKKIFTILLLSISFSMSYSQVVMKIIKDGNLYTEINTANIDTIIFVNETFAEVNEGESCLSYSYNFKHNEDILYVLGKIYTFMNPSSLASDDWGYKPNIYVGSHPTLDTQATGWDKDFNTQSYNSSTTSIDPAWTHAYQAVLRCNAFIKALQSTTFISDGEKQQYEAEARALRGFFYTYLAQTYGRVPVYDTGEDYSNTPNKRRATYEEMWDYIINDFSYAQKILDWNSARTIEYSCETYQSNNGSRLYDKEFYFPSADKGMALTYLADAYMWKAYVCPQYKSDCLSKAKATLKQIIDSKHYELMPSFSTNWDATPFDYNDRKLKNKECIWATFFNMGYNHGSWDSHKGLCSTRISFYTACPENGGWGSLYLSWEWYAAYEKGDKRRDASCVTGAVPQDIMAKYNIEPSSCVWGYNPFLQTVLGYTSGSTNTKQFHYGMGEYAPSIWSTKFWRNGEASWSSILWPPTNIYWKRYANVLIDYAECCFETGDDEKGWAMLDIIRNRAWGNLEVGNAVDEAHYLRWFNQMAALYQKQTLEKYPLPLNTETVTVPSAKEFYTSYAKSNIHSKAFASDAWKVAVNEERRKEFNCEWCLRPDMLRSGFLEDHINTNYPIDNTYGDALKDYPWTNRTFVYDHNKDFFPIPQKELERNNLCDQNPGY